MSATPEIKLWVKRARISEKGVSYETFRLLGWIDDKRIRKQFKSRDEAEGEKARLEIEAANEESGTRTLNTRFTAAELADAEGAFAALAGQATLSSAVQWYLANYKPPVIDYPLPDAKAAFLADRKPHVRLPTYRDYEATLDALIAAFPGRSAGWIKTEEITAFLEGRKVGKKRFNNLRGDLNAFFAFCVAKPREWARENPVTPIPKFKIARGLPDILTPEKCAEVMAYVETYRGGERSKLPAGCLAPYFALCLFAGLRPAVPHGEVWKIAHQKEPGKLIDVALGVIRVTPDVSKVKGIRQVKIRENLAVWLKRFPVDKFPLIPVNAQAMITDVRKRFGLTDDVLRHTYISAHVAAFKSMGEAALEAGNSEVMIRKHYLNMLSDAQAAAFWGIVPKVPAEKEEAGALAA